MPELLQGQQLLSKIICQKGNLNEDRSNSYNTLVYSVHMPAGKPYYSVRNYTKFSRYLYSGVNSPLWSIIPFFIALGRSRSSNDIS